MEIFKKASKKKLRFSTPRGVLSVENLWDLNLEEIKELVIKAREAAKKSAGEITDAELSFLDAPAKAKTTDDDLRFEILKDIYLTKKSEAEAFDKSREGILADYDMAFEGDKHNALYDAKVIKALYSIVG